MRSSNHEQFLKLYDELDELLRTTWGDKEVFLDRVAKAGYKRGTPDYGKLHAIHKVRSTLSHSNGLPFDIVVGDDWLSYLQKHISRAAGRRYASQMCISSVYTTTWTERTRTVLQKMHECEYSHVPIVEHDGRVVGVLGEDSIVHRSLREEMGIDGGTTVAELKPYCQLSEGRGPRSETIGFIGKKAPMFEVVNRFETALRDRRRLSLLIVTENGHSTDRMIGIITVWDLAAGFPQVN